MVFFIRLSIMVVHWSRREIESYSVTVSVNASTFSSSRCVQTLCRYDGASSDTTPIAGGEQ